MIFKLQEVEVVVLQEDIDRGKPKSSCECPVALALLRALGPGEVFIGNITWLHTNPSGSRAGTLNTDTRTFIVKFDTGQAVEPFAFRATFTTAGNVEVL